MLKCAERYDNWYTNKDGRMVRNGPQYGYEYTNADKFFNRFGTSMAGVLGINALVQGGLAIAKQIKEVRNDMKCRMIIEDLSKTDPVLSKIDHDQLMEWFATIHHFAPKFSQDKSAVREVLQNFARFGRVDVNTLKMLADTEKSTQDAASKSKSWGDVFTGLANSLAMGS